MIGEEFFKKWVNVSRLVMYKPLSFIKHNGPVNCVSFASDGRAVISGCELSLYDIPRLRPPPSADDGEVKIWGLDGTVYDHFKLDRPIQAALWISTNAFVFACGKGYLHLYT